MDFPVLLAHGELGAADELIFIGIAVLFTGVIIYAWFKSRSMEPLLIEDETNPQSLADSETASGRFKLE